MMRAMSLMTRTMQLRGNLLKFVNGQTTERASREPFSQLGTQGGSNETASSLLQACFGALEEFDSWDIEAESYWRNTFDGRSTPAALGELSTRATYYDPKTACIIILVRSARLILLLSILEYHDTIRFSCGEAEPWRVGDEAAWAECIPVLERSIRLTIDDMLCCVPFALGDLSPDGQSASMPHDGAGALVIIQPMRLVTFCAYATPEQRKYGQDILSRMKLAIGLRSATSYEEQAASTFASSAPQRPGTQSLIRAMALLATRDTPTPAPTPSPASY
jgi:hypothetical protein